MTSHETLNHPIDKHLDQKDPHRSEEKSHSHKDDQKQQMHVNKQQSKQQSGGSSQGQKKQKSAGMGGAGGNKSKEAKLSATAGADIQGGSLVGGVQSALGSAVQSVNNLLPSSLKEKAADLSQAASKQTQPITDAYQKDGIKGATSIAAQQAGSIGAGAAQQIKSMMPGQGQQTDSKKMAKGKKDQQQEGQKKRRTKRRRGGRGHGNRKMKMREIVVEEGETIKDTLGDKVSELKEVKVDDSSSSSSSGILGSIRSTASGLMGSVSSAMSGATGAVSEKVSNLSQNAKDMKDETLQANKLKSNKGGSSNTNTINSVKKGAGAASNQKPKTGGGHPPLERQKELSKLGTPLDREKSVIQQVDGPMIVNVSDQSSLKDKASFAKDVAKESVQEKAGIVDKAMASINDAKDAIVQKVGDLAGGDKEQDSQKESKGEKGQKIRQ